MNKIHPSATDVLDQLGALLVQLSPEYYARPLSCLQANSLGKHVRHILEFFECLLDGIPVQAINYDLRRRDLRLETEPAYAMAKIDAIQKEIPLLIDGNLLLQADLGAGLLDFSTTIFRELVFCMDHCMHHLALIRIGIQQHFPEIRLDDYLGVAFSTRRYLQEQSA